MVSFLTKGHLAKRLSGAGSLSGQEQRLLSEARGILPGGVLESQPCVPHTSEMPQAYAKARQTPVLAHPAGYGPSFPPVMLPERK